MLMGDCETRLDIPNWNGVFDWKHDHIRCPELVVMNFFTVGRTKVLCLLATVDKVQMSVRW